jgi:hypothetical protein
MHSTLKLSYLGSGSKMQAKLRYIILFLFLFFTSADAQAPVRPLEPAFRAMEKENWDKAFLLADKDGDLGPFYYFMALLKRGFRKARSSLEFFETKF